MQGRIGQREGNCGKGTSRRCLKQLFERCARVGQAGRQRICTGPGVTAVFSSKTCCVIQFYQSYDISRPRMEHTELYDSIVTSGL